MHAAAYEYVAKQAKGLALDGRRVLEIGSLDVNGTVRGLFHRCERYDGIDRRPGRGVDVVCDVRDYAAGYEGALYDVVVCCEVLEHDPAPREVIEAAEWLLKAGGVLILTAAGEARAPHGCDGGILPPAEHYRNVSDGMLAEWLTGWDSWQVTWSRDRADIYATAVRARWSHS